MKNEALNEVNRAAISFTAARDNETEESRDERRTLDAEATRAAREAETRAETEERNTRNSSGSPSSYA